LSGRNAVAKVAGKSALGDADVAAHPPTLGNIVQESAEGCEVVHTWKKKFVI
jgi:hypothetical protein